jgi:hypothetical protein
VTVITLTRQIISIMSMTGLHDADACDDCSMSEMSLNTVLHCGIFTMTDEVLALTTVMTVAAALS